MDQSKNPRQTLFYGWVITGAIFLSLLMSYGAQYSFGVLFPSLIEEFKWSRQSVAGAFSLYTFMYCFLSLFLGRLTDRFGPRIILILGSACLGTGIGLISLIKVPWHLYLVYGLLASWGMSAAYITGTPTIVKWFVERRGLALGVANSGLGVGIIIIPLLTGLLITAFGWRQASITLGASVFIVLFMMALFLISHPEKMGLQPDGRQRKSRTEYVSSPAATMMGEVSWSVSEAIHTRSFWVLTVIFFSTWLFIFLPLVHLVIFAIDLGLSKESALWALSILGGCSSVGRLLMGFISDRIGRKLSLRMCLGLQIFSWLWIMGATAEWMLFLFSAIFGFSYGGISTIFPAIIGDYFGRLKAASVIGAIFTIAGTASAIGPFVGGYIYDATRGYTLAFLLAALSNFLSLILAGLSQPPKEKGSRNH